jgi:NAD(P)-dependent dehydrogenase (short-subunit alcohol dehydrogenase family)
MAASSEDMAGSLPAMQEAVALHRPAAAHRVAIVTGANHGIGAAVAEGLASSGVAVLVSYLRSRVRTDPGTPERYQQNRLRDGEVVAAGIVASGGRATALEADLLDPATPAQLFDAAEAAFGPVDILVNNATGKPPAIPSSPGWSTWRVAPPPPSPRSCST